MKFEILPLGPIAANCIVLWGDSKECWIIDPGEESDALIEFLEDRQLKPVLIAYTHGHFDHIGATPGLLKKFPSLPVHVGPGDVPMIGNPLNAWGAEYPAIARPDTLVADLEDNAEISAGGISARIIATPGHTPGGVCFLFEQDKLLLSGDTLFAGSCGRTDFPGGNMRTLQQSLKRLASMNRDIKVVPGHGMSTSIGREVDTNPYIQ